MITTLTLNPCIDHTIEVEGIEIGGTNRIRKVTRNVAGKGINVSTALAQLGYETCSLGFSYGDGPDRIEEYLEKKGICCRTVTVPGRLRTNIKVFDREKREMSEFNESGFPVSAEMVGRMLELIREQLPETKVLVVSGSVPPGVPEDFYRRVIELAGEEGVMTILDADNGLLREGIKANPTMIKTNLGELGRYLGRKPADGREIIDAAVRLSVGGIPYVCASAGADGAYLACGRETYYTKGAPVEVRGVQGAGDSLVAGFAVGLSEGRSPAECLRLAVACADASLLREGTGMCERADVERLIGEVKVISPVLFD